MILLSSEGRQALNSKKRREANPELMGRGESVLFLIKIT